MGFFVPDESTAVLDAAGTNYSSAKHVLKEIQRKVLELVATFCSLRSNCVYMHLYLMYFMHCVCYSQRKRAGT